MKTFILRTAALVICAALSALAFRGTLDPAIGQLGSEAINSRNDEYLDNTFNKALSGFITMSAIKTGLAVVEGSTVGVSAGATGNLQMGDVVQSAYDYIDIAWRTLLTGSIAILSIQHLLGATSIIGKYILCFTLAVFGVSLFLRWWFSNATRANSVIRDILGVAVVALLAVYYILPVSVWGAARLSQVITQPSIEEAQKGFQETKAALFSAADAVSAGWLDRLQNIPDRIRETANYIKDKTTEMMVWTIKLIAGYIFDCIVFPLALFALLFWLTKSIMRYIFQKNLQSSIRDDLQGLIVKRNASK